VNILFGCLNMLQPGKTVLVRQKNSAYLAPDPEAIRYNPLLTPLEFGLVKRERIVKEKIPYLNLLL